MTLPVLQQTYKNVKTSVQLKKAYSELQSVVRLAEADYGPVSEWAEWGDAEKIVTKYFLPYYQILKKYDSQYYVYPMCGYKSKVQYSWLDGVGVSTPFSDKMVSFHVNNGTCIGIEPDRKEIYIDINGARKDTQRNIFGRDIFIFVITATNKVMPLGYNFPRTKIYEDCKTKGKGQYCAARIMQENWEINY